MALIDQYSVNFHKLVFAIAECAGLCWIYGIKRFKNDIRTMLGDQVVDAKGFLFWVANWCVVTPLLMVVSWWDFQNAISRAFKHSVTMFIGGTQYVSR